MNTAITTLVSARLVNLVTYRKDGRPVATAMLSVSRDGVLLFRTHHTAGKLKRLRNNNAGEVAPCAPLGRRIGPAESGSARILPKTVTAQCLDLLHRRHGWQGRLATALRHLRGWRDVFIEVQQT
jgi:uncharacterized protein